MKRCSKCGIESDNFQRNKSTKDGLQAWCRTCRAEAKNLKQHDLVTVERTRDGNPQVYVRGPNHGESKTPLYKVWKGMRERCGNPKAQNYRWYGGRGIKVCDEWQNSYLAFKSWAMSAGYEEGMQLDRIENGIGYEPSNCRWVTRLHNLQNRRAYLPENLDNKLNALATETGRDVYDLIRDAVAEYVGEVMPDGRRSN